ncbi:minor histocompatibility antigen H13 [Blastomyces gilchristii SLH14081]|uniref:Minor histocompatibility antigen H13 n=1 Tax=Blastomyces gilchristii (strain SLH14081) TaxID=559298 RepID=A0A179UWF7_BLAGS|nr:minor histocompatibility antigen H13 [Blastomyces gilchristii SLH14081]OAT11427.1 minor histocompatibility antigen H13 [Blastomyces gilchristii SLH14081]
MDAAGLFAKLLDRVQFEFSVCKPLIPTYSHLVVSALFPIYIGAHASLTRPSSAAKPTKPKRKRSNNSDGENQEDSDEEDEEDEEEESSVKRMEGLEPSDAIMFPIMAGLTLCGLYLLIKWVEDPAILNKFLGFYFSQAALVFAVAFMRDGFSLLQSLIFPSRYALGGRMWKANQRKRVFVPVGDDDLPLADINEEERRKSPLPGYLGNIPLPASFLNTLWDIRNFLYTRATLRAYIHAIVEAKSRFTILDVISIIIALAAVYFFTFVSKPWWLTNFLGFSVSYGAMQFMSPTTFGTASLVLGALFFYDIYFVFFTPLMVTVAKSLDIPIKLVFPRPATPGADPALESMAMLGLGDIVVPGMVMGLALRFDLFLYYKAKAARLERSEKIPYVSATGRWGERFWTTWFTSTSRYEPIVFPQRLDGKLTSHEAKNFPKTYFHASIVGYVIGMLATLLAMQISHHAQPALLYLVPCVLGSLWIPALVKGDITEMWNFSDVVEEEEENEAEKGKDSGDKSEKKEEKETISPSGIIRRMFFERDTSKAPASASSPSSSATKWPEPTKDSSEKNDDKTKKPATNETSKSISLFSLSISIPKSKLQPGKDTSSSSATTNSEEEHAENDSKTANETKQEQQQQQDEDLDGSDQESEPSSSSSSTPVLVGANPDADVKEPALKKRRT